MRSDVTGIRFGRPGARAFRGVLFLILTVAVWPGRPDGVEALQATGAPSLEDAAAAITSDAIANRIYFLASDGLQGRNTPSPGLDAAAAYVVSEYRRMGLEPAGENGYYQHVPLELRGANADASHLELAGPEGRTRLEMGHHFFALGSTEEPVSGRLEVLEGEPDAVDDSELDLEGAVAAFPVEGDGGAAFLQVSAWQVAVAEDGGAAAVLHVLDGPIWTPEAIEQVHDQLGEPRWALGREAGELPRFFVPRDAMEEALTEIGGALDPLAPGSGDEGTPSGVEEEVQMEGHLATRVEEEAGAPNVIGMVEGSDPERRHEYVALSAHLDHVGVGTPQDGDSIYNGADDNASGTAALMEVAGALSSLPPDERPARSVLFVHVSGEEKGLLGSEWWVDHPTVPIEDVVANINADMIAGDAHPDTVMAMGKEYSELGPLVRETAERQDDVGLTVSPDLLPEENLFYRSDQYHFMRKEIPALFLFTGLHDCYHQPCDTADFIDPGKAAEVARLLFHSTVAIGDLGARPEWDPEGLAEVRQQTGR